MQSDFVARWCSIIYCQSS